MRGLFKALLKAARAWIEPRVGGAEVLDARLEAARDVFAKHQNILFFAAGFLFDALTLERIDAWIDLATQTLYLAGLATLILLQRREELGLWKPAGRVGRFWDYAVEAQHFFYGGLLSMYAIFYSKSGTGQQAAAFFVLVFGLMVFNELPVARKLGHSLRFGLMVFCLASFSIYFVPMLVGRMGGDVFVGSLIISGLVATPLAWGMADPGKGRRLSALRLGASGLAVLLLLGWFYARRWIPPVPLSVQYIGVFHEVVPRGGRYLLTYEKRPWWAFWRSQDRPFYAREDDKVHCFARIFAPTRFTAEVRMVWSQREGEGWIERDAIPLTVEGGRRDGFRGYAYKERYSAGEWRVAVQVKDGRTLGDVLFRIVEDESEGPRRWKTLKM